MRVDDKTIGLLLPATVGGAAVSLLAAIETNLELVEEPAGVVANKRRGLPRRVLVCNDTAAQIHLRFNRGHETAAGNADGWAAAQSGIGIPVPVNDTFELVYDGEPSDEVGYESANAFTVVVSYDH